MRFAHIRNAVVVNVIEAADANALPGQTLIQSDSAGPGDTWDGLKFTRPAVTPLQPAPKTGVRRLAERLIAKGVLTVQDITGIE